MRNIFLFWVLLSCWACDQEQQVCDFYVEGQNNYVIRIDDLDQDQSFNFPYEMPADLVQLKADLETYDPSAEVEVNLSSPDRITSIKISGSQKNYEWMIMDGAADGMTAPSISYFDKVCD